MKYLISIFCLLIIISCKKVNNPAPSINRSVGGQWSITLDGGASFTAPIYAYEVYYYQSDHKYHLTMDGSTFNDVYSIYIGITMPSKTPTVGHYYESSDSSNEISLNYMYDSYNHFYDYYDAGEGYPGVSSFDFYITGFNPADSAITATFSATLNDGFGNLHYITNGSISGVIYHL